MFFARSSLMAALACLLVLAAAMPAYCSDAAVPSQEQFTITPPPEPKPAPTGKRATVGLCLGGGGTRGAAHVGVLKVLQQEGIPIDCVVGTSMGAIVGGFYAAGVPIDHMEQMFNDMSLMKAYMTVPLAVRIIAAPVLLLPRLVSHPYDGLYRGNKFRKYLLRHTPECERNIEDLKIPYAAVAVNLADGKIYRITKGNIGYAMQASSAVPGLRKPVQIDDKLFCDGGIMANVPVEQTREMGADIVIAVDVDERFGDVPLDTFRAIGSVSKRLVTLQLATVDAPQLKFADIVIHPQVDGIGLISTRAKDGARAMAAGEAAARAALPQIREKLSKLGLAQAQHED